MVIKGKEKSFSRLSRKTGPVYTETIELKNSSKTSSMTNVSFDYYDALHPGPGQQVLTTSLGPQKSVKVDLTGKKVRITQYQFEWTSDSTLFKGSLKATTPGFFLVRLKAAIDADGSEEGYLFTQHSF